MKLVGSILLFGVFNGCVLVLVVDLLMLVEVLCVDLLWIGWCFCGVMEFNEFVDGLLMCIMGGILYMLVW